MRVIIYSWVMLLCASVLNNAGNACDMHRLRLALIQDTHRNVVQDSNTAWFSRFEQPGFRLPLPYNRIRLMTPSLERYILDPARFRLEHNRNPISATADDLLDELESIDVNVSSSPNE